MATFRKPFTAATIRYFDHVNAVEAQRWLGDRRLTANARQRIRAWSFRSAAGFAADSISAARREPVTREMEQYQTKSQEIIDTAKKMVAGDKGLLAIDESNPTCNKRFARLGIPQTEEARRAWREFIVTTLGLGESISGANVIVADKHLHLQYLDMDAAVRHCQKGIRIWPWARLTKVASRTS
jgi:hypothetical protein